MITANTATTTTRVRLPLPPVTTVRARAPLATIRGRAIAPTRVTLRGLAEARRSAGDEEVRD